MGLQLFVSEKKQQNQITIAEAQQAGVKPSPKQQMKQKHFEPLTKSHEEGGSIFHLFGVLVYFYC